MKGLSQILLRAYDAFYAKNEVCLKKYNQYRSLEDTFLLLQSKSGRKGLSFERVLKILAGRGRYLLLIFLSLPFCFPITLPGLSTPFGLAIVFIGLRSAFGKNLWFPRWVLDKTVPAHTLRKVARKGEWAVKKMRKLLHERVLIVCRGALFRFVNGILISFMGFLLALPLPVPFSNTIVAFAVFFLSIGLLEDDGVWVIVGYGLCLAALIFFIFTGFAINAAVNHAAR